MWGKSRLTRIHYECIMGAHCEAFAWPHSDFIIPSLSVSLSRICSVCATLHHPWFVCGGASVSALILCESPSLTSPRARFIFMSYTREMWSRLFGSADGWVQQVANQCWIDSHSTELAQISLITLSIQQSKPDCPRPLSGFRGIARAAEGFPTYDTKHCRSNQNNNRELL